MGTRGRGEKSVQGLVGKLEGKRLLGRPRRRREDVIRMDLGRLAGVWRVDWIGSGWGSAAGSCECGDEPSGSGATELVKVVTMVNCSPHHAEGVEALLHAFLISVLEGGEL
jgi:hypothetical protein